MWNSISAGAGGGCGDGADRGAGPAFEVASVKPAAPLDRSQMLSGQMHVGMKIDAARVDIGGMSLADLIRVAYRVKPYQVSGPDWMAPERFDVLAKMPEGATREQVPEMLQALLAERFKLAGASREQGTCGVRAGGGEERAQAERVRARRRCACRRRRARGARWCASAAEARTLRCRSRAGKSARRTCPWGRTASCTWKPPR